MRRDSKGRYLPRKKRTKKTKKRRKRNPQAYPRARNPQAYPRTTNRAKPRRKSRRRKRNPAQYPSGAVRPAGNPRRRRTYNPNNAPVTLSQMIKPTLAAIAGFLAPGLVWYAIGENNRTKMRGWFKGTNPDAKARATIGALTTLVLYFLSSRVKMLTKIKRPLMIGTVLRTMKDGADAFLGTTPGSSSATLRMILSLPTTPSLTGGIAPGAGLPGAAAGAGAAGAQAGYQIDPTTGQMLPTQQGQPGSLTAGADMGMDAGYGMDAGMDMGMDAGMNMGMDQGSQMFGLGESDVAMDPGLGDLYVDRQLTRPNRRQSFGTAGYHGMGSVYVDRNLVFSEAGQRFPARLGFFPF